MAYKFNLVIGEKYIDTCINEKYDAEKAYEKFIKKWGKKLSKYQKKNIAIVCLDD